MKKKTSSVRLTGKKVLISGGMGFIGSNLAHQCLKLDAKVTIYDCLDPRSGGNFHNIKDIRKSVELVHHDILNFDQVCQHILNQDIIFNCAASTSHPFSMREPWIDLDVNSRGVINLLEAVRRFNRNAKFIHLGTSTQIGRLHYQPADENHPEFPTDIYSANKCVSEKFVLIYANAYKLRASVMRLSNVFGPRASIHSPEFTFNNFFIGLALQGKDICVFGDGKQKRNVIFVNDAVDGLIRASRSDKVDNGTFFLVGDHHYSVTEIAKATMACLGTGKIRQIDWPKDRKPQDIGDAVISNKNFKKAVDWKPKYDLEKGLLETKKYYRNCLENYLR